MKLKTRLRIFRNAKFTRLPKVTRLWIDPPQAEISAQQPHCNLSDEFLLRVSNAYRLAPKDTAQPDIWNDLRSKSNEMRLALESADIAEMRRLFSTLLTGTTATGYAHTVHSAQSDWQWGREYFSTRCRDAILALAEAVGVIGVASTEQTSWDKLIGRQNGLLEPTIEAIEHRLGHSLAPVDFGSAPIARIDNRWINPDFVRQAYVPYRIEQIGIGKDDPIIEIGGGLGHVARYVIVRGYTDYTIVDLPFVLATQAAFLASALGEAAVSLFGEERRAASISLHPANISFPDRRFALAINMDSLPEMAEKYVLSYLSQLKRNAMLFLSVNQEAGKRGQHIVSNLADKTEGFCRLSRHPYWMEQGYVEELYKLQNEAID
ncbi:putative sugar O-methyltransferase [Rhizobium sp. BG4]|uniref:putative sugar O-methyltransferase n=1 Tax=Rhizobium sp. BG4 TaxID=2613770 RepID=UPI00193DE6DE|nr:putative sugar O-methyltransferase [Rhizobium sp. BG4]QRM43967.1 putative sugar O-methyltransferase [Rhizobium sp. BG4]